MRELHLFAGAGGGILGGMLLGHTCVCAVEIEPYCRKVLLQRQRDGILPKFPIWDDVRTFDGKPWKGLVDVVCGGFPCQPFSIAGSERGEHDERNCWTDTIRIIREVAPPVLFLENVPKLLTHRYFGRILGDIFESGHNARWKVISSQECGTTHLRERLWIFANSTSQRWSVLQDKPQQNDVPKRQRNDPEDFQRWSGLSAKASRLGMADNWQRIASTLPRSDDAVANRMERLKSTGNGQVPAVVKLAWETLSQ